MTFKRNRVRFVYQLFFIVSLGVFFFVSILGCWQVNSERCDRRNTVLENGYLDRVLINLYVEKVEKFDVLHEFDSSQIYFNKIKHLFINQNNNKIDTNHISHAFYISRHIGHRFHKKFSSYLSIKFYQISLNLIDGFDQSIYGKQKAEIFHNIGVAYYYLGMLHEAISYTNEAIQLRKKYDNKNISQSYNSLAVFWGSKGETEKAIVYLKEALRIGIDKGISDKREINLLNNIGDCYRVLGRFDEANNLFYQNLEKCIKLFGKNSLEVANIHVNLANVSLAKGEFIESNQFLRKAFLIRINKQGNYRHLGLGNIYEMIGQNYLELGVYDEALTNFQLSLKTKQIKYAPSNLVGKAFYSMATLYERIGNYEKSLNYIDSVKIALKYRGDNGKEFKYSMIDLGTLLRAFDLEIMLNQKLINSNGKYNFLNTCKKCDEVISLIERFHKESSHNESIKRVRNEYQNIFQNCIINDWRFLETASNNYDPWKLFEKSEKNKASILLINLREYRVTTSLGQDLQFENLSNIKLEIAQLETQRQKIDNNELDLDKISKRLFELNFILENNKKFNQKTFNLGVIKKKEIQSLILSPTQSLLEYFIGDSSIFLFVINKNNYQVHEVKKDFPLEDWVKTFRKANSKEGYQEMAAELTEVSHNLYQKLIAPVADLLREEVIIIPDGILGYVPFEALLVEPAVKANAYPFHHYWLKDKQISYCYSATLLREMQEKKHKNPATKDFLGFAPFYDGDTTLLANLFRYGDEEDKKPLKPLPKSGEEVYGIEKALAIDAQKSAVFYREAATEDKFVEEAGDYRILHLASHGKANDKVGDYSYLAFTEQKDSLENEFLFVRDLYNLQLAADMVVLSACETGIGELQRGEGIISLARGFTYAGAKSIITSLWSVADEKTKNLMIDFYKYLKLGYSKDAALRQAKLDFIARTEMKIDAHPFFWSGFIGIGDMEALEYLK